MKRSAKIIAFVAAVSGALLFSIPEQASKLSGGRKLAEATSIITERCFSQSKSVTIQKAAITEYRFKSTSL